MSDEHDYASDKHGILYGGPDTPLIEPDCRSLGEVVLRKFAQSQAKPLFTDAESGQSLCANELRAQSIRLARGLRVAGIGAGDVIGLCCENRLEFPAVVFAGILLGATIAPLNTSYTPDELHHALHLSRPRIVVASALTLARLVATVDGCPFVQHIISLDGGSSSSTTIGAQHRVIVVLSAFIDANNTDDADDDFACATVADMRTNVSLILCSSGTTGLPKGVQLTQFNLHTAISGLCVGAALLESFGMGAGGALSVIPWFHAYGLVTCLGLAVAGVRIVTLARYTDRAFLAAIERHRCDVLFAVPPLLVMLAKVPFVSEYDLSSLQMIYSGAAPLSSATMKAVQRRLPGVLGVFQGFGMSEMTLSVLQQSLMHRKEGSLGVLRPGMWGKVVDAETGRTLAAGERGEMCFRGPAIMRGYVGDERATRSTIDADGWLHTGDVGFYDADGEWFIVDRLKELIKYKGYQVPPAELEALLLQHPLVVDAGVIGVPDESCGEKAMGFVVPRMDAAAVLDEQEVLDFVAARVSYAKRLHGGVRFVAEIPKNQTGKILRRELRELVAAQGKSKM